MNRKINQEKFENESKFHSFKSSVNEYRKTQGHPEKLQILLFVGV